MNELISQKELDKILDGYKVMNTLIWNFYPIKNIDINKGRTKNEFFKIKRSS